MGFSHSITHSAGSGSLFLTGQYINDKGVKRHLLIKNAVKRDTNFCKKPFNKTYDRNPSQINLIDTTFSVQNLSLPDVDTPAFRITTEKAIGPDTLCYQCYNKPASITGDSLICPNEQGVLSTRQSYDAYLWSTGSTDSFINIEEAGSYWIKIENSCGKTRDTQVVSQFNNLNLASGFRPRKAKPQDSITFFDSTTNADQRFWYIGNDTISNEIAFKKTFRSVGNYPVRLKVKDTNGCLFYYRDALTISHFSLFMPNTFSPKDDGHNDRFSPVGYRIKDYRLSIFNRWGQKIYEGNNEGWQGKHKGQLVPPGQYIYKLNVTDFKGDKHLKKGFVRVTR